MTREEFENLVNSIKDRLDDTTQALVSEDLIGIVSTYTNVLEEVSKMTEIISKLEADKEDLLKVNGKLFQKIAFEKDDDNFEPEKEKIVEEETIKLEDVIDEKGEIING